MGWCGLFAQLDVSWEMEYWSIGTTFGGHLKEAKGHSQPDPLEIWRNAGGWFIRHACMRVDWFRFLAGDCSS